MRNITSEPSEGSPGPIAGSPVLRPTGDLAGQQGVADLFESGQPAGGRAAFDEASRRLGPGEQHDLVDVGEAAALVVDEAVIA